MHTTNSAVLAARSRCSRPCSCSQCVGKHDSSRSLDVFRSGEQNEGNLRRRRGELRELGCVFGAEFVRVPLGELLEPLRIVVVPTTKLRARSEVFSPFKGDLVFADPSWPEPINQDVASRSVDRLINTIDRDPLRRSSERIDGPIGGMLRVEIVPQGAKAIREPSELIAITGGETLECVRSGLRESQPNDARVVRVRAPSNEAGAHRSVDELHRAVVAKKEITGDVADCRVFSDVVPADRK